MQKPPFEVKLELEGWSLFWAELKLGKPRGEGPSELLATVSKRVRQNFDLESLSGHPTVAGLRKLFREAGCDPTRYRPSSEALLRRVLKGTDIPSIHALVDLNNCLSVELAAPCCVMTSGTFEPPLVFRKGRPGESYESLRGPFNLEKKPLIVDQLGPLDAPITGSQRVKVTEETGHAWLVAYLPSDVVQPEVARTGLEDLVATVPLAEILFTGASKHCWGTHTRK